MFNVLVEFLESLSLTSDNNTDTNNRSCACALLARSTKRSVSEVTATEVGLVLEVVGGLLDKLVYIRYFIFFTINT
jgi:hypothetical protein